MANLINSFLETACNPKFGRNQFHEALFKLYVLEENSNHFDIPQYFRGDFFPAIKRIHSSTLNVAKVKVKEIYRFLVEEITMDHSRAAKLLRLRIELAQPTNQWSRTWSMARQSMLDPNLTSFLFKMLHQILPTAERVARILPNQSPHCSRCNNNKPAIETLKHAMFDCEASQPASSVLLQGLRKAVPGITPSRVLTLDFDCQEEQSFPVTWAIAHFLSSLWQMRVAKKAIKLIKIRSEMEASCRLLRESRLENTSELLTQIFTELLI